MAYTLTSSTLTDSSVMGGAPAIVVPGLNDFQQLIYVDDLADVFFNNDEFAVSIAYYHSTLDSWSTYQVLFDNPYASVRVAEGEFNSLRPQFQVSEAALVHPILKQDRCTFRGRTYYVEDFESDGVGVTTVYMRLK